MNNEFFLLKGNDIIEYISNTNRKSIEFEYIKEKGYKIKESYLPRIKYLDAVDEAFFKETV
jgi:recombination protein U